MTNFNSEWLARKIEEIVDAPRSPHSVIAAGVDEGASRAYAKEVRNHLDRGRREATDDKISMVVCGV